VWLPFINGLSTEVNQTKRILLLIPIEMLIKIKGIEDIVNESSGFGKKKKSPGGSAVSLSDSGSKKSGVSGITD
jgi:hypothetical protein